MFGPHMPWPMMNIALSLPKAPSSCCQITRSIGLAPRPPYSCGQCRQAQPPSAFSFCQALPTSTISSFASLIRPSEDFDNSASYCFGALASIHLRAVVRNSASCGVSSKFMAAPFALSGASLGRNLVEGYVLVDPDVTGQPKHAFGNDVAHDLVGAAFDAGARRAQQHRLEFSGGLRVFRPAQHAGRALQVQRIGRDILDHGARDQLADGIFRPRPLALRQRGDRAKAG